MEGGAVRFLVIGSINMDLVMELQTVPGAGETVLGRGYSYIPGGKGANQAVAAARLGGEVAFCGRVGNDSNGKILLDSLRADNIDTSFIKMDDKHPTGLAVIPVESNGENRIMVFPGANDHITRGDIDRVMEQAYDAIIMQLEIPLDVVYYAFDKAKAKGIPVILDAGPARAICLSKLQGIHVLSPNESEATALTGIKVEGWESSLEAAKMLANASGASYVVIKMGEKGALLYERDRNAHEVFPAYRVKAVDSTAAGDSFTAAMTVKMLEYGDIRRAIPYANAVGALCVSKIGAQPSLPGADEVEQFLALRDR
ncbi:MAG TPA: ribokinase [Clostridia bacterium]|nr:ribokinase [Clostridia bacterium]